MSLIILYILMLFLIIAALVAVFLVAASLMIANPISGRGISKIFSTHPPAEERIKRLKKLAENLLYQGL